jgi:hypothetical protein
LEENKMSLSNFKAEASYQHFVFGSHGIFSTTAGKVAFLSTKARLGCAGISPEHRLTAHLSPVREALPPQNMNFNQLLQRDLDDHRVAVELVPYLLSKNETGPAFFPPIVAVALPFSGNTPLDNFSVPELPQTVIDEIGSWETTRFGQYFKVDRLLLNTGNIHFLNIGRFSWNAETTKLVVIDGQHRAMALLAIDRTINSTWAGSAEKYKAFYETAVHEHLASVPKEDWPKLFQEVELPVNIIWFPELDKDGESQQLAARKIFVDLNKNARPPSESRIQLLSDSSLTNIFMRQSLNGLRDIDADLPIYAVEYDNPDSDQSSATKWSAVTNVANLSNCIKRLLCGPEKHFSMDANFIGRDAESDMALLFRKSLDLSSVLEETIEEEAVYRREDISNEHFPRSRIAILTKQYDDGWGAVIETILGGLSPFKCHAQALRDLRDGWTTGNAASTLAKDSIFEGVGIYWTLRDGGIHWRMKNDLRRERMQTELPVTDVVDAWKITQTSREKFSELRATRYIGNKNKSRQVDSFFSIFSTSACQVGLILAIRALNKAEPIEFSKLNNFANVLVKAINAALEVKDRKFFISKDESSTHRLNLLGKLDTPFSAYFRYFWMELMATAESTNELKDFIQPQQVLTLAEIGRWHYRSYLLKEACRDFERNNPDWAKEKVQQEGEKSVDQRLKKALKHWFGIIDYEAWKTRMIPAGPAITPAQMTDDVTLGEDSSSSGSETETDNIDDLLDELNHKK